MSDWRRVNREHPCPICGKPDWCSVTHDGVLCMRIGEGAKRELPSGGWIYESLERRELPPKQDHIPKMDAEKIYRECRRRLSLRSRDILATSLGVSRRSLEHLDVGWSCEHNAYTFPMRDSARNAIGIRLRTAKGRKYAIKGSRSGLFIPPLHLVVPKALETLWICEGPTDLAALLTVGLWGIGRPSCTGSLDLTYGLAERVKPKSICIVADDDAPGVHGAEKLRDHLGGRTYIVTPGAKDIREWVREGATREQLIELYKQAVTSQQRSRLGTNQRRQKTTGHEMGQATRGSDPSRVVTAKTGDAGDTQHKPKLCPP
jgi:hypothetical protein